MIAAAPVMRFALLFILACLASPAFAWGPGGHEIAAAIAADNLTASARAKVGAILGGDARALMILDSSWADDVRSDRPETGPWHYVNIPLGARGYDARRDCPHDDCVVAEIARFTRLLGDARTPRLERTEALRFLIHFVADIHQPLHAADDHDRGGNSRFLYYRGKRMNLHGLWDQDAVRALGRDPLAVAAAMQRNIDPRQRAAMSGGTPADWANESLRTAESIYAGLPANGRLPNNYADSQRALTQDRLARAGLRLAALLNRIL